MPHPHAWPQLKFARSCYPVYIQLFIRETHGATSPSCLQFNTCTRAHVHTAADGKIVPLQGPLSELPLIIFLNSGQPFASGDEPSRHIPFRGHLLQISIHLPDQLDVATPHFTSGITCRST